jgi:hypothetical protein
MQKHYKAEHNWENA